MVQRFGSEYWKAQKDVFCYDQSLCVLYIYSNNVEGKLQHAHVMEVEINMHNT